MDIEDVAETNPEAIYKVGCGCYWQSTGDMDIEDVAETNPEAIYKVGCGCYWQSTGRHGHRGRGRDKP